MTTLVDIEKKVSSLPRKDYKSFRHWFYNYDWEQWDKQIGKNAKSGELDFLIQEVEEEKRQGTLRKL